jgi:regulator of sirC expression with transglutaminase-like and TPR domain
MTWDDRYLDPCTKYEFLFRILNNLKVVYERTDAPEKALGVVQRMLMVRPDATALYQDLASLQQHLHQYRAAISSLESYLRERGDATDAPQVKSWIDSLKVTLSRLN